MSIRTRKAVEYSVAQARKDLPFLIKVAESGTAVAITRRGTPVAVLVSVEAFERGARARARFLDLLDRWRSGALHPGVPVSYFEQLLDRSPSESKKAQAARNPRRRPHPSRSQPCPAL